MSGRQHIAEEGAHRDYFTILPNLLDVWRDERGEPLEPWAVRVYFHFARLCGTSRDGHVEESERETAAACGVSVGTAHRARARLAETGWITLEYEGPPGHEVAYITLVDRQQENHAYWVKLRPRRDRTGLRSYIERQRSNSERNGPDDDLRSTGERQRSIYERGAPELAPVRSANDIPSSLRELKTEDVKEQEEARAAREDSQKPGSFAVTKTRAVTFCRGCGRNLTSEAYQAHLPCRQAAPGPTCRRCGGRLGGVSPGPAGFCGNCWWLGRQAFHAAHPERPMATLSHQEVIGAMPPLEAGVGT